MTELNPGNAIVIVIIGSVVVFKMPNVQQIMANKNNYSCTDDNVTSSKRIWYPTIQNALLIIVLAFFALSSLHKQSPFLYFQF
ncbi:MAG: hypothetical protein WCK93_05930 [Nitrosomonadales bacterium]